jgi:putative oxidoreductase
MNPAAQTWKRRLLAVLAWCFGGIFIYSGWIKVQDPARFLVSVRSFHLLPDPSAAWLALGLPWLEIFAGIAVLTGWLRRGGLLLLNASLLVFAIALVSALARGLDIDCGCFGAGHGSTSIRDALLRDAALLLVGGYLFWVTRVGVQRSDERFSST